jgi:DNA-binding FadR family transcriptional regulator
MGRGRPQGSRNKKSIAVDRLLAEHSDSIVRKCMVMALQGDPTGMRLCMERLSAPLRETPVRLKTPTAQTVEEVRQVLASTLAAVAGGRITPSQGELITRMLEVQRRGIESADLKARLAKLETWTTELKDK